jgi:hypothetical protein
MAVPEIVRAAVWRGLKMVAPGVVQSIRDETDKLVQQALAEADKTLAKQRRPPVKEIVNLCEAAHAGDGYRLAVVAIIRDRQDEPVEALGAAVAAKCDYWYRKLLASRQWRDLLKAELLRANASTGVTPEEAALREAAGELFFEVTLEPNLLARKQLALIAQHILMMEDGQPPYAGDDAEKLLNSLVSLYLGNAELADAPRLGQMAQCAARIVEAADKATAAEGYVDPISRGLGRHIRVSTVGQTLLEAVPAERFV